jgi:hypothetical protein
MKKQVADELPGLRAVFPGAKNDIQRFCMRLSQRSIVKVYAWDRYVDDIWTADGEWQVDGSGPDDSGTDENPAGGIAKGCGKTAECSAINPGKNIGLKDNNIYNNYFFST